MISCVRFFATPWTIASPDPLSMQFPRQGYWSGLPFPSPGDIPDPGIEPMSPSLASGFFTTEPPGKPVMVVHLSLIRVLASGIAPQRHSFLSLPMDEMNSQERPCKRRSKTLDLGYEAWTLDITHQLANKCLLITHWAWLLAWCVDTDMSHSWVLLWKLLISSKRPKCVYQSLQ